MSKGEETKAYILQKSAEVFNKRGYYGASMSDIMAATGMEKGGIYNHFKSKDDLALQAFEYATDIVRAAFAEAIKGKYEAVARLQAVVTVFQKMPTSPLPGGCPLVNTAIQSGGTHDQLSAAVAATMQEWHAFIIRIVEAGLRREQLKAETDPATVATLLIASLEGAIILTNIYQDSIHMKRTVAHLNHYLTSLAA